jgi:predicted RNase H-like HicB family nuclease
MKNIRNFTAVIEKEDDMYVSLCPELDVASQGDTVEEAKANLQEAIELLFEHASKEEIETRIKGDVFITNLKIAVE